MTQEPPEERESLRARQPDDALADFAGRDPANHAPEAVQSLKQAMRRARFDDAERVGVLAELRAMQIGRLELLQESLRPLLAQIPSDVDLFDVGIMPGATPRLFIDMIGFVEMGRDARLYRLLQDTRHTRMTLAESTEIARMVEAVTDYVARRLLERDKALAADSLDKDGRPAPVAPTPAPARSKPAKAAAVTLPPKAKPPAAATEPATMVIAPPTQTVPPRGWRRVTRWSGMAFAFVIDLLGATTLFTILAVVGWYLWNRLHGQI